MAEPIKPQKKTANGKDTWWVVPTVADITEPVVTEVNSASGLNITCFLLAEQEGITGTTEKVALARLLCETSTTEGIGETTWSMADVQIVFDPQAASGEDGKKAWTLLKDGFTGVAIRRQGVVSKTDAAVTTGQFVDAIRVEFGPLTPGKSAADASGIYTAIGSVAITDTPAFNVAVVAS